MRLVITGDGKCYVTRSKIFNRHKQSSGLWSSKPKLNDKREVKSFTQRENVQVKLMSLKATNKAKSLKAKVRLSKSLKRLVQLLKP